jgi:hypothetical protein
MEAWVAGERICSRDADELAACFAADAGGLFGYACVLTRGDRARRRLMAELGRDYPLASDDGEGRAS